LTSKILRFIFISIGLVVVSVLSLPAQALEFADGLVYNDFYAVAVSTAEGDSFTLFDAASFEGDTGPYPDSQGYFGSLPGSAPGEGFKYFFWVRRVGPTGAITYPLSFRKIRRIDFTGPYGGTPAEPPDEAVLSLDGAESPVTVRLEERRFSGWFGRIEPPVPSYSPAQLELTDGTVLNVYLKTDGFLGGIDEDFGTYAMLWLRHDGIEQLVFQHDGTYARCPECGAIFYDERTNICPFDKTELIPSVE